MPVSALQVARTGLEAQDARMRVIANNLANVGTTGYKRDRANFATLTYQDVRVAGARSSGETAYATGLNLGTGVSVESTSRIMTQGAMNPTGNAYDLALDGDGYFQIQMPGGQLGYTRAGNFTLFVRGADRDAAGIHCAACDSGSGGCVGVVDFAGRDRFGAARWRDGAC